MTEQEREEVALFSLRGDQRSGLQSACEAGEMAERIRDKSRQRWNIPQFLPYPDS